ncbi:MAG: hypothetical protein IJK04_08525, partial [Kiritimatiellae bacterium]|nr:hypothetical protein [Kiritimatiellia bacterium]
GARWGQTPHAVLKDDEESRRILVGLDECQAPVAPADIAREVVARVVEDDGRDALRLALVIRRTAGREEESP